MPETSEQLQDTEPLENRIDALLSDIDATAAAVCAELGDESPSASTPEPAVAEASVPTPAPSAAAPLAAPSPADAILGDVASELDPGVPAPEPIAAAPTLEPVPAIDVPKAEAPLVQPEIHAPEPTPAPAPAAPIESLMNAVDAEVSAPAHAQPTDEVDDEFVSPESIAPAEDEVTQLSSADAAAMHADLDPPPEMPVAVGPAPTIQELDDELAAAAGDAVEQAIITAAEKVEEPPAPASHASAASAHATPTASKTDQPASASSAASTSAPQASATAASSSAPRPSDPSISPFGAAAPSRPSPVLTALAGPLNDLHERVPETMRQTIGYLAVMTVFFSIVMWGIVLLRTPAKLPATVPVPLVKTGEHAPAHFNPDSVAERAAAEAERKAAESAEGHAKSGDEHGAKSDKAESGHGKSAEKKSSDHDAPPPDKKKKPAEKDAHH